jgi:hypothetical protein
MVSPINLSSTVLSVLYKISDSKHNFYNCDQIAQHFNDNISHVWIDMSLQDLEKLKFVEKTSYWGLKSGYRITASGQEFLMSQSNRLNLDNLATSTYIFESSSAKPEHKMEISSQISAINWTKWGTVIAAVTLIVTILMAGG